MNDYLEIKGIHGTAKVFTDTLEETAREQVEDLMNQEWIKDQEVAIMPDVHAGAGNVIGLTISSNQLKFAPSLVGNDIGCGVSLFITDFDILDKENELNIAKHLDSMAFEYVPVGEDIFDSSNVSDEYKDWLFENLRSPYNEDRVCRAFGTLGGGNHFIEAYNYKGKLAIAVHSGSRSLGSDIYKYYTKQAEVDKENADYEKETKNIISVLKDLGKEKEIQETLAKRKAERVKIEKSSSIQLLEGDLANDYLNDVEVATEYASSNRIKIFLTLVKDLGIEANNVQIIDKPHNFIEVLDLTLEGSDVITGQQYILRKGAQSGYPGSPILVPINMRDGLLVATVKDDLEVYLRNFSAPHGAGRKLSRSKAKQQLDLEVLKEQMKDVYTTSISEDTLDESPDAYKSIEEVGEHFIHLCEPSSVVILKPFWNKKG